MQALPYMEGLSIMLYPQNIAQPMQKRHNPSAGRRFISSFYGCGIHSGKQSVETLTLGCAEALANST
jgi:hypothetical protein